MTPFLLLVIVAILFSVGSLFFERDKKLPDFLIENISTAHINSAKYLKTFICNPCLGPAVHSASIVKAQNGSLVSVWFGGTREGAQDVKIYQSTKSKDEAEWSAERPIVNRVTAAHDLGRYLKKLGNPVLGRDMNGRLWLFYVSVSAGGWSGSAINYRTSKDGGESWSPSKRLVTSPFFNVSTLVRGVPLVRSDGSLTLPVYHELLGKFSELLQINADGSVLAKRRISHGKQSFQPVLAALTKRKAALLARSASSSDRHIFMSLTQDAGETWSTPVHTSLPNPDAGIAAASAEDNSLLVVYNDSQSDRGNLALAISHDLGETWKRIFYFEHEKVPHSGEEYSYPTLIRSGNQYHLVYTWRRKGIRYVRFNSAWIKQQEERK